MYYQDVIDDRYIMNRRAAWKAEMKALAEKGNYEGLVKLMARNWGDKGNVISMVENFAENSDPWPGSGEA